MILKAIKKVIKWLLSNRTENINFRRGKVMKYLPGDE